VIGTLKFLCPSEGRNGARIANSNSRSECLVTGAEFVGTYCTKATPPSRLIVYARSWYRVQIWRALRLTEILTNSETPSELTLASNAPNVSRQNPLHLQMLPPAAVSGGTFRALSCPAISETGMSGGLDLSNDPAGRWPHTAPPAPHWRYASASRRAAASGVPNRRKTCQSLSDKRQGRNSQDAKSQPRNYERIICGQFEHCGLLQAGLQKLTPTWRCGTRW
jgi:hypothetical protein